MIGVINCFSKDQLSWKISIWFREHFYIERGSKQLIDSLWLTYHLEWSDLWKHVFWGLYRVIREHWTFIEMEILFFWKMFSKLGDMKIYIGMIEIRIKIIIDHSYIFYVCSTYPTYWFCRTFGSVWIFESMLEPIFYENYLILFIWSISNPCTASGFEYVILEIDEHFWEFADKNQNIFEHHFIFKWFLTTRQISN